MYFVRSDETILEIFKDNGIVAIRGSSRNWWDKLIYLSRALNLYFTGKTSTKGVLNSLLTLMFLKIFFFFVGNLLFYWFSSSFLYSVLLVSCSYSAMIAVMIQRISTYQLNNKSFDNDIRTIQIVLVLFPMMFTPATFWLDTKCFVEYIHRWTKFEINN